MTPHQKIIRADQRGTGLRLTPDEVSELAKDGAILQVAENDDLLEIRWKKLKKVK